jgi:plastocyanin
MRPLAAVDDAPRATIRVRANEFKFAPTELSMRAGEPTRIELENDGAVEHALIVAAPDGKGDWIHLHAMAKGTDGHAGSTAGKYQVVCWFRPHRGPEWWQNSSQSTELQIWRTSIRLPQRGDTGALRL